MKVITKYPVYVNKKKVATDDFSNLDDTLPTDPFSFAEGDKQELIKQGVGAAASIGTALLNKPKQFSEVENKCGKRPKAGRERKRQWDECAKNFASQSSASVIPPVMIPPSPTKDKKNNTLIYVGLGVVALGVVGYLIYKNNNVVTAK
jgi:hypothetical protein